MGEVQLIAWTQMEECLKTMLNYMYLRCKEFSGFPRARTWTVCLCSHSKIATFSHNMSWSRQHTTKFTQNLYLICQSTSLLKCYNIGRCGNWNSRSRRCGTPHFIEFLLIKTFQCHSPFLCCTLHGIHKTRITQEWYSKTVLVPWMMNQMMHKLFFSTIQVVYMGDSPTTEAQSN